MLEAPSRADTQVRPYANSSETLCRGSPMWLSKRSLPLPKQAPSRGVQDQLAHGTKKHKRLYNGRTAVERVNSRLKCGLTLDELIVRGKKKITLKLDLAIIALYALALGHLRRKAKHWRSYTRVAD